MISLIAQRSDARQGKKAPLTSQISCASSLCSASSASVDSSSRASDKTALYDWTTTSPRRLGHTAACDMKELG